MLYQRGLGARPFRVGRRSLQHRAFPKFVAADVKAENVKTSLSYDSVYACELPTIEPDVSTGVFACPLPVRKPFLWRLLSLLPSWPFAGTSSALEPARRQPAQGLSQARLAAARLRVVAEAYSAAQAAKACGEHGKYSGAANVLHSCMSRRCAKVARACCHVG